MKWAKFAGGAVVVVIASIIKWQLGVAVIALLAGYLIYRSRPLLLALQAGGQFGKGNEDKALELLERVSRMKSVRPSDLNSYGFLLLRGGKLDRAKQVLEQGLGKAKSREDIMLAKVNLANVHWLQNERAAALELLEQLYGQFKHTTVYGNYGYLKLLNGHPEEALALNLEAYEYNGDDKTIADNLAQNYCMLGRYEEAEELYRKVMGMSPKYFESHYYYALTLLRLGKREDAREQIAVALEKPSALIPSVTTAELERLATELDVARKPE